MSSEMIERVARAICKSQTQTEKMWEAFLPEARSAIEAMREPTDAMVDATGDGECRKWAPGAWQAMITAALSEVEG